MSRGRSIASLWCQKGSWTPSILRPTTGSYGPMGRSWFKFGTVITKKQLPQTSTFLEVTLAFWIKIPLSWSSNVPFVKFAALQTGHGQFVFAWGSWSCSHVESGFCVAIGIDRCGGTQNFCHRTTCSCYTHHLFRTRKRKGATIGKFAPSDWSRISAWFASSDQGPLSMTQCRHTT